MSGEIGANIQSGDEEEKGRKSMMGKRLSWGKSKVVEFYKGQAAESSMKGKGKDVSPLKHD